MRDIQNIADVRLVVDTFYAKVREDTMLQDIFNSRIQDRWQEHLEKMYRFWQTVLLDEHTYQGSPFPPHAKLPINREHFEHWIQLFNTTINEHFKGDKADRAIWQAKRMAELFEHKINYYRNPNNQTVV